MGAASFRREPFSPFQVGASQIRHRLFPAASTTRQFRFLCFEYVRFFR